MSYPPGSVGIVNEGNSMNHTKACQVVVEYRDVIYAAVVKAGKKFGRHLCEADRDDLATSITITLLSRSLPRYDGRIKVRSFVWMVADREARKAFAKSRATARYDENADEDDYTHCTAADDSSIPARVAARIACKRLVEAVAALSAEEQALVAAMAEGTTREYAADYGLTPVQMTRAKAKVRAKIAGTGR